MARANRHHISGQVWHITHRCHKREFLLKFSKDRTRWVQWLFEAIRSGKMDRQSHWSESVAVGGQEFIREIKIQLGKGSFSRKEQEIEDCFALRETSASYSAHLSHEKGFLSSENSYFLPINDE